MAGSWRDGAIKQYLVTRILTFRKDHSDLFAKGTYTPLNVTGVRKDNIIAFIRSLEQQRVIVVVPRLIHHGVVHEAGDYRPLRFSPDFWEDTAVELPEEANTKWTPLLDSRLPETSITERGMGLRVAPLLQHFPMSVLASVPVNREDHP